MKKLVLLLLIVAALFPLRGKGLAQGAPPCGGEHPVFAFVSLPVGNYDIYATLGATDANDSVKLWSQPVITDEGVTAPCSFVGQGSASGDRYSKVADHNVLLDNAPTVYYLEAATISGSSTASAPKLVFVERSVSYVCDMTKTCDVTYQGSQMRLIPKKISLTSDSLRVAQILPIQDVPIKQVVYSVDNKPAYTSKKLEAFDLHYASWGKHAITRTVILQNGEALTDTQQIEQDFSIDKPFVSVIYGQKTILTFVVIILGVLLAIAALLSIVHRIRKYVIWRRTHIVSQTKSTSAGSSQVHYLVEDSWRGTLKLFGKIMAGVVGAALLFIGTDAFVLSIFTVDGPSMETTLHDTSRHPLYKLPITISKINRHALTPKRGEVVVFLKDDNNLFEPLSQQEKNYVVKRVIGLPGERVQLKDGRLRIYNKEHPDGFDPDVAVSWSSKIKPTPNAYFDVTLQAGELFVCGDNREESVDSRSYGPIKADEIVGKVWYSPEKS